YPARGLVGPPPLHRLAHRRPPCRFPVAKRRWDAVAVGRGPGEGKIGARGGEGPRRGRPDARRGAGDDGGAAGKGKRSCLSQGHQNITSPPLGPSTWPT